MSDNDNERVVMEKVNTFKKRGVFWDLWICHPIDIYFVTPKGSTTGKRKCVAFDNLGHIGFEYKPNKYCLVPEKALTEVGYIV